MLSKIYVDVQEDGSPCITIRQSDNSSDVPPLADKVLQRFFEKMGPDSQFVGVLRYGSNPSYKVLIPMDIPHVLEWLCRFLVEERCNDKSSSEEVLAIFDRLRSIYKNESPFMPKK